MKILIAEDQEYVAYQYENILKKYGHDVETCNDGEKCISTYLRALKNLHDHTNKCPFDLVILDHDMPGKKGVYVAQEIFKKCPNQRILFATAYTSEILELEKQSQEIEILEKPFSLSNLIKRI